MPRKVFLSFLGTSDYVPVAYYREGQEPPEAAALEKYVQKAILDKLAGEFSAEDVACIFLTGQARAANWAPDGHVDRSTGQPIPNSGLRAELSAAGYVFSVRDVAIDDRSDEASVWRIFETLYDCLEAGDTVYLDITHSWRFLPMLGMSLLNYAKALKNIEVGAIFYGAFERLGRPPQVAQMPEAERRAPILNLAAFSELQDWSAAAHDFTTYGKPGRWNQLAGRALKPILAETKGQDASAANLRRIGDGMKHFTGQIAVNRGGHLRQFDFSGLTAALARFSAEQNYIKPLSPIIDRVKDKMASFEVDPELRWLACVGWCVEHGMIQQGVTQLQEGLLTFLCVHYDRQQLASGFFDWRAENARTFLSAALNIINQKTEESEWYGIVRTWRLLARKVIADDLAQRLAPHFSGLTEARNDINHGGYTGKKKATAFRMELIKRYEAIRPIVEAEWEKQSAAPAGLLNISNHPSTGWPENQRQAALDRFGAIEDLPFPAIDPAWTPAEVDDLAEEYRRKVRSRRPAAVHLMGEMTFTHALLQKLRADAVTCLASTTERLVREEEGRKIVQFRFVQFREYP